MEILILVKQVPDDSFEIHLDPSTGKPDLSRPAPQASAFETYGLEMAVRYIEGKGEGNVTLVTVGGQDSAATLRNEIAVGANRAFLISDGGIENADSAVVARAVAAAIPKMEEAIGAKFDLILAGRESTDYIDGEVGGILSEILGRPLITNIVDFSEEGGRLTAKKELDSGYRIIEAALPCVCTISKPNYDPRYPTIKSKMAARKVEIPEIAAAELAGLDKSPRVSYLSYSEPPQKEAGLKFSELEPDEAAAKIMECLAADKVL